MAKARLLQAVSAAAMLASAAAFAPAFAQSDTQAEDTGANNRVNAPVADSSSSRASQGMMSPGASGMMHHSEMGRHTSGMMHTRNDQSQEAAVEELNERSFRAAQQGHSFSASESGSGGMAAPNGSAGSMPAGGGATGAGGSEMNH